MKKIFLLCFIFLCGLTGLVSASDVLETLSIPLTPSERVLDIADILDDREESQLNTQLEEFDETHNVEVAIVTLPKLQGYAIEEVAIAIGDTWRVGKEAVDNGIIVVMSLDERQWRIETGYGVEGDIPDVLASQLGESILVPAFREQRYASGFSKLIQGFADILAGVFPGDVGVPFEIDDRVGWLFILGLLSFFIAVICRLVLGSNIESRSTAAELGPLITGLLGLLASGTLTGSIVLFVLMISRWHVVMLLGHQSKFDIFNTTSNGGFGSSGGRGGGSFGGGFSGFGGGSFGGGGASGSW